MIKVIIRKVALFFCAAFLLSSFAACKKNSDSIVLTKTELLTRAPWKMIKAESKTGTAGAWIDNTGSYAACEKDDNFVFYTTGNYELNEGLTKCAPADPQIYETGTWTFINSETELKTSSTGSPGYIRAILNELTENSLIVTSSDTSGVTIFYHRGTYVH